MMKKCLSVILLLALMIGVVSAVPMNVSAENVDVAETSADSFTALFKGGDTDMDGTVNIMDVTTLQMSMSNMRTPIDASLIANVGDVDQSNSLDITDATFIQRKLTGIETPDYVKVNEYTHEVTLPENNTLSQPNLKATTGASDITLSWNKISGADCYRVFTKKYGKWRHLADTSANNCTDIPKDIKEGGSYAVCCMNDSKSEYVSEVAETSVNSKYTLSAPTITRLNDTPRVYFTEVPNTQTLTQRVVNPKISIQCEKIMSDDLQSYCFEMTDTSDNTTKCFYNRQPYQNSKTIEASSYDFKDGVTYRFRVWGFDSSYEQITPASEAEIVYHEPVEKVYNNPLAKDIPLEDFEPYEEELEAIRLINEFREENGLHPLEYDKELSRLARIKVEDTVENDYYGHESPVLGTAGSFIANNSTNKRFLTSFGENLTGSCDTAELAIESWKASLHGHRENLLGINFELVGIGYHRETGRWIYLGVHDKNVPFKHTIEPVIID